MIKNYVFVVCLGSVCLFLIMFCCGVYFKDIYKTNYSKIVFQQAQESDLEPSLVFAIIKEESAFDVNAISVVGAVGLMQIMPLTAIDVAGENFNVELLKEEFVNIKVGCSYFKYLLNKFQNKQLALIAYNAGEGNLANWINNGLLDDNLTTPFPQTNAYVKKVLESEKVYKKILLNQVYQIDWQFMNKLVKLK